jgi:hypothetical protein
MKPEFPSRSWNPWPVSIFVFFALALIGCGALVTFCSRHPADLITANYYEDGINFQGQVERVNRTQHLAGKTTVAYDDTRKCITIALPPEQIHHAITGSIQLYRPAATGLDREIKLEVDSAGTQHLDAATLLPGLWKVRISWTVENQEYFTDRKILVQSKPS